MKQAIFLISLFCCLSLIAQPHSDQGSGHAADLFITPDSSLSATIRKAREMRRLDKAAEVTIHLAPGTYALYEPLQLRPEDSGLTITGDKAIISGGLRISNWKKQGKLWVAAVPDFNGRPIDFRQLWITGKKATRARDVSDFEQMARIRTYDKKNQVLWVPKKAVEKILKAPTRRWFFTKCGAPATCASRASPLKATLRLSAFTIRKVPSNSCIPGRHQ